MTNEPAPEFHQSRGYWTVALGRLARSGWGMAGLAVIVALLAIAVLAPFLASSFPIVMMSSDPVVGEVTGQPILEPGLSFPLFAALGRQDLLILLTFAALALGSTVHLLLRRAGRPRRTALATSVVSVGLPFLLLSALIFGLYESRRALLDQADFHEIERGLGEGEWSLWPPVRYGPDYSDPRVDSWLKPPWLGRSEAEETIARGLAGEDWEARVGSHFLGTERRKWDVLSMMIHGTRISLSVGFVAVTIYITIGVILGALAGFYGGRVDAVIMRLIEVVTCFPILVLVVAIAAVYPPSIYLVMVVISLVSWPFVARLVRGEFLRLREQEFVQAAIALGASDRRVIFRHILPNAISPVLVAATFGVAASILVESALSFLGIGVPVDSPTWGNLLRIGKEFPGAWWVSLFPGLAILVTILSYNLLAEALRDALDPRLEKRNRS